MVAIKNNNITKDNISEILNDEFLEIILEPYKFTVEKEVSEEDGLVILCLDEIEFLITWGDSEDEALTEMAKEILGHAEDYFGELDYWYSGNGKKHAPYLLKAILINDVEKIKELIICRPGEN